MNDPFDLFDYGSPSSDWRNLPFPNRFNFPSAQDNTPSSEPVPTGNDVIFDMFKMDNDQISMTKFMVALQSTGLKKSDPRLRTMVKQFQNVQRSRLRERKVSDPYNLILDRQTFKECIQDCLPLLIRAFRSQFVIPDWKDFCIRIEGFYGQCRSITEGTVRTTDYMPLLTKPNPEHWGVAVCTVDGQRLSLGEYNIPWCLQSVSKPLTYGIALNEHGADYVHMYVGQEPSGRLFNEICLDHNSKPHNPLINAGAIVVASLIKNESPLTDRIDFIMKKYKEMAGGEFVGFSNTAFQSEREHPDRDIALAYYMREHKCFPKDIDIKQTLDLYFQLSSVEVTCESAAVIAATLANGGVCPLTNVKILSNRSVQDVLTLMYSCGMYDYSGQFAFQIGLPAKSGVSGGMILVVPNVMGFALWSPPLDSMGNTARGVAFCRELIETFNFHNYDNLVHGDSHKKDPRKRSAEITAEQQLVNILYAAKSGDLNSIKKYALLGYDMNGKDYDGRSALHLAAAEGHADVVGFLLTSCRVSPETRDRWRRTPLDEAIHFKHEDCIKQIKQYLNSLHCC